MQPGQHLLHGHHLPPHCHVHLGRRRAGFFDGARNLFGHAAQIYSRSVSRHRDRSLHIVAFVLACRSAFRHAGNVAQQNRLPIPVHHRKVLRLFHRVHFRLWNLHLNLISHSAVRVSPIIRHHKPARGSRRYQRTRHFGHLHPHQPGPFAVHSHIDRRIVQRLAELHVAQRRNFLQLLPNLASEFPVRRQIGAAHRHLDGRSRSEAHDSADNVAWLERKTDSRQLLGKTFAQALFQVFNSNVAASLQLHLHDSFFGPAVPEINQVDRITRRVHPHEPKRNFHVLRAGFALDHLQRMQRDGFSALHVRATGSAQPQLKLARVHPRENIFAQPLPDQKDDQAGQHKVHGQD